MSYETEVKLGFKKLETIKAIISDEDLRTFGEFKIISMNAKYYDTKDLDLLNNRFIIRVRRENGENVQTLKSKPEVEEEGLFLRDEWEVKLNNNVLDLDKFKKFENLPNLTEVTKEKELFPIVETDFIRRKLVIVFNAAKIEVAVDYGKILGGEFDEIISEVELELKEGSLEDLMECKDWFLNKYSDLKTENKSKFGRGLTIYKESKLLKNLLNN